MGGKILRCTAIMASLCLALGGCVGLARRGADGKESQATGKIGNRAAMPDIDIKSLMPKPGAKTGDLRARVLDDRNKPLAGAIIVYKGPQNGKSVTNAKGEILVHLKPGKYALSIQKCGVDIIANTQQRATAVVTAGTKTPVGVLDGIHWARRFSTPDQGKVSVPPPWHIGQTVSVGIAVQDDCSYQLVANYAVPMFAWRLSSGFKIVGTPVYKTDKTGFVNVNVRCVAKPHGVESIVLYDRKDATINADIMLATSRPDAGHDWCE